MEIIILKDHEQVSRYAFNIVSETLKKKRNAVLGMSTGKTPLRLYELMANAYKKRKISFKDVITFNLDEYIGIDGKHIGSYRSYMNKNLFLHTDINPKNIFFPDNNIKHLCSSGNEYEKKIKQKGGIDLQILGIGENGHIGYNEPISSLSSRTRVKMLTSATMVLNKYPFKGTKIKQPRFAMTMGIGTIMEAKKIIILATGSNKEDIVAKAIEGPVTAMHPASVLQFHNNVKFIIDEAAAKKLKLKDYYKEIQKYQKDILKKHKR
ncbi:MAG: glucosamine-6-phosphate deaminase [Proteobacteria bacterium]|nr:glucosamine-6-phosphate deaminase [Pseudomonadota bacterium]